MAKLTDGRQEFRNNTKGYIGVVQYAPNGDEKSLAVAPDETVWLNEAEVELTTRAPRKAADSPFGEQRVPILDPDTGETIDHETVIPLTLNSEQRQNPIADQGLRPEAQRAMEQIGKQPARGVEAEGSLADDEEVGTPGAQSKNAKNRRRAPASA